MIGLDDLEKLIKVTLFTGYIKGERPVSLLIIANPESGKTELVKKTMRINSILYLSDFTAYGITDRYFRDIESGKIKHIVIPDLTVPLGKGKEAKKKFIGFFSMLIEEGIVEIQNYATKIKADTKRANVNCGLIATITPDILKDNRSGWHKIGFMTRLLPVSYSYSQTTIDQIFQSVFNHQYREETHIDIKLPETEQSIVNGKLVN